MRCAARRQRGTASTEALILLPFFFIVWGCLFFTHSRLEQKVVVNEIARTCAWERMSSSCLAPPSPRCSFGAGQQQLSDADLEGASASMANLQTRLLAFTFDLRDMFGPVFRPIFSTAREGQVNRPRSLGGGQIPLQASFSEMCNEVPGDETEADLSSAAFCALTGWCG